MPNWVDNNLTICGNTNKVHNLLSLISNGDRIICFDKIKPIDKEQYKIRVWETSKGVQYCDEPIQVVDLVKADDSTIVNKNGDKFVGWSYDWYRACLTEWGTKWNSADSMIVSDEIIDDNDSVVVLAFSTAWSAPIPILERLAEMADGLEIRYYAVEEGMGIYINGDNLNGKFETRYYDGANIYSKENKKSAVEYALKNAELDPEQYDIDKLIEDCTFTISECEWYDGFDDVVLDLYEFPPNLNKFKT